MTTKPSETVHGHVYYSPKTRSFDLTPHQPYCRSQIYHIAVYPSPSLPSPFTHCLIHHMLILTSATSCAALLRVQYPVGNPPSRIPARLRRQITQHRA